MRMPSLAACCLAAVAVAGPAHAASGASPSPMPSPEARGPFAAAAGVLRAALADGSLLAAALPSDGTRLTHPQVLAIVAHEGLTTLSAGNCSDRADPTCTSFEGLRARVLAEVLRARRAGCPVRLTGGTEVGHAPGTYSHANGWKLDTSRGECIDRFARSGAAVSATRWRSSTGAIWFDEGNHWDVGTTG